MLADGKAKSKLIIVMPFNRSMLDGPNTTEARNMLIELVLSIPARLSDLLVVLTSLMRPLVMALQEGQELVGLGLRTLEYWVDRYRFCTYLAIVLS